MSLNAVHRQTNRHITKRSDRLHNHFSFHTYCVKFCGCKTQTSEKFDSSIISFPGFSLVAAGYVTFCDNGLLIGVGFLKTRDL